MMERSIGHGRSGSSRSRTPIPRYEPFRRGPLALSYDRILRRSSRSEHRRRPAPRRRRTPPPRRRREAVDSFRRPPRHPRDRDRRGLAVPAGVASLALVAPPALLPGGPTRRSSSRHGGSVSGTAPLFLVLLLAAFATYLLALLTIRRQCRRRAPSSCSPPRSSSSRSRRRSSCSRRTRGPTGRMAGSARAAGGTRTGTRRRTFPTTPRSRTWGRTGATRHVYGPAFTIASEPLALAAGSSDEVAAWTYKALAAAASPRLGAPGGEARPAPRASPRRSSAGTRSSPSTSPAAGTTTPGSEH